MKINKSMEVCHLYKRRFNFLQEFTLNLSQVHDFEHVIILKTLLSEFHQWLLKTKFQDFFCEPISDMHN